MKLLNYKAIFAVFALFVTLASCSKSTSTPVQATYPSVINAVPSTESLDVFFNGTRVNNVDFAFGTKLDYGRQFIAGSYRIDVSKKGATVSLKNDIVTMEPNLAYSIFVIDKLENVKFLTLKDDLSTPATGKAKVRFVNLSPDSDPLDLAVVGKTDPLTTNKAFKEYGNFETIDAAAKVTFNVKNKATGAVLATLTDVNIESQKIYTIYAKGLKAATEGPTVFGAAIFTHK